MLRINRLKIEIKTENGVYGFDETFAQGLNLIASEDNTCGKSSIIAAIYYCLGFEEIIGGRGERVLTSVYKSSIEDGETVWPVLESGAYLEISNGEDVNTVYRAAKMENRDSRLITVYYSPLSAVRDTGTIIEDMYVHMPNSAINKKGFHNYLETFLHLELPNVPASDEGIRKLYLQLIFSSMFVEQKHGWADILSGMPILGIRESKKRVLEFILNLHTLDNEKRKDYLRSLENEINSKWGTLIKELIMLSERESSTIHSLPLKPKILTEEEFKAIVIKKNEYLIDEYIDTLKTEHTKLLDMKPRVVDNFDELQEELNVTEDTILEFEGKLKRHKEMFLTENISLEKLAVNLEIINNDISNNKDAARLRELGSELNVSSANDLCPVCNQEIQDSLLPNSSQIKLMSIDENIRHLNAQKEMLEFALNSHRKNKEILQNNIQHFGESLFKLRRLAKSIRSDLYLTNEHLSETVVYKRLQLEHEITNLNKLKEHFETKLKTLKQLSEDWKMYLSSKAALPTTKFTESDEMKLRTLRKHFIDNLRGFGYKSILNLNDVEISTETYLPVIEGFDMKFDSSASDNIRAIWAFTLGLVQTSTDMKGNHPGILIFDEPAQHSIVPEDMKQFFQSIIKLNAHCQVFVGITNKDSDTRQTISELPPQSYHLIRVPNKAFQLIDNEINEA